MAFKAPSSRGIRIVLAESECEYLNSSLQTGITVIDNVFHHEKGSSNLALCQDVRHTVDGNSNTFSQNVAICADEARDHPKLVGFVIFLWYFPRHSINDLEVKFVCFGNCANGSGTWVALCLDVSPRGSSIAHRR